MKYQNSKLTVLISADEEWKYARDYFGPVEISRSPFGETFQNSIDIGDRHVNVIFFQTGCGKIPASAATQYVIDNHHPELIINLGTCGGFKGKVKIGEILLIKKAIVYDIIERSGYEDEQIAKYVTHLDLSWITKPYPMDVKAVTIASADQDLDPKNISYLSNKYKAVAADWESGAIAYVAHRNKGINLIILRGVSDVLDQTNGSISTEEEIIHGTRIVMKQLLDNLGQWIKILTCNRM
jgi:adenosylhomocysteine nucleosidase